MLAGSGLIIFIYIKESRSEAWALVGVVVVFLSMFPYLNNKIFKMEKPTAPNHRQDTQSGSINHDGSDSSEPLMHGSSSTISYHTFHSSSSSNMTGIKNVTPDGNNTPPDNASAWKVVLISAFFKIVMIISAIFILFAMKKMNFQDAWDLGWNWSTSDKTCRLVIAHIAASLVAYVTAVFACRTCIDRGAFLMPLLLSSPVVYILLVLSRSCKWLNENAHQKCLGHGVCHIVDLVGLWETFLVSQKTGFTQRNSGKNYCYFIAKCITNQFFHRTVLIVFYYFSSGIFVLNL